MEKSVHMLSWNIKSGGFSSYDPTLKTPEREKAIQQFIGELHTKNGVDTITLPDAHRWDEVYGNNEGIARHLGFQAARFTRLEDERLNQEGNAGIGIAFATDKKIETSGPLDLDTRLGLNTILDIGKDGLQVSCVYLDDLSEDRRLQQIRALFANIEKDVPTIITGDFNLLRPNMRGATINNRIRDVAIRSLAATLPRSTAIGETVKEMNRRLAYRQFEQNGFLDADRAEKRPTAPAQLPLFGIDYFFHNQRVVADSISTKPLTNRESDHLPLMFKASIK